MFRLEEEERWKSIRHRMPGIIVVISGGGGGILGYLHRSSSSNDCCSALFDVSAQMISPDFVDYIYREAVNGNRFVSTTVPSRLEHVPRYTVSATKTYLRSLTNLYDTKGYTFNIGRIKISIV